MCDVKQRRGTGRILSTRTMGSIYKAIDSCLPSYGDKSASSFSSMLRTEIADSSPSQEENLRIRLDSLLCGWFIIMAVLVDLMVLTFSQRGGFLKHPTPGGVPVSTTSPGWRVMNLYNQNTHIGHNQHTIPYSWKI